MPDHKFATPDATPLFPEDDPLTVSIPGGAKYLCLDRANPPLEGEIDPERKPVSYLVELLTAQVVPELRDEFRAELTDAVRENRILVGELIETSRWIGDQRREAERAAVSEATDRPTRARRASTR